MLHAYQVCHSAPSTLLRYHHHQCKPCLVMCLSMHTSNNLSTFILHLYVGFFPFSIRFSHRPCFFSSFFFLICSCKNIHSMHPHTIVHVLHFYTVICSIRFKEAGEPSISTADLSQPCNRLWFSKPQWKTPQDYVAMFCVCEHKF